jgi:hypothetical protein
MAGHNQQRLRPQPSLANNETSYGIPAADWHAKDANLGAVTVRVDLKPRMLQYRTQCVVTSTARPNERR